MESHKIFSDEMFIGWKVSKFHLRKNLEGDARRRVVIFLQSAKRQDDVYREPTDGEDHYDDQNL